MSSMKRVAMSRHSSRSHPSAGTAGEAGPFGARRRTVRPIRAVLSRRAVAAIEHRIGSGSSNRAVVDFEFHHERAQFGSVPLRAFPAEWSIWPVAEAALGIGVCLPVGGGAHLGVALDRQGRTAWFVVDDSGARDDSRSACRLLDDACRMRLGLSTDSPDRPPDWYWLGRWLAAVVDAASLGPHGRLDVITTAAVHPAIDLDELSGLDLAGLCGFVVDRHRDHVRIADWECIHLDALNDAQHPSHVLAAAFDVGGFSRWVTAGSSPLSDLASRLTECCSPLALRLLGAVIADTLLREQIGPLT